MAVFEIKITTMPYLSYIYFVNWNSGEYIPFASLMLVEDYFNKLWFIGLSVWVYEIETLWRVLFCDNSFTSPHWAGFSCIQLYSYVTSVTAHLVVGGQQWPPVDF